MLSKNVMPSKRKSPGRPGLREMKKGDVTPIVGLRVPRDLRERAEYWALTNNFNSMSEAYRKLIEMGLKTVKRSPSGR